MKLLLALMLMSCQPAWAHVPIAATVVQGRIARISEYQRIRREEEARIRQEYILLEFKIIQLEKKVK